MTDEKLESRMGRHSYLIGTEIDAIAHDFHGFVGFGALHLRALEACGYVPCASAKHKPHSGLYSVD